MALIFTLIMAAAAALLPDTDGQHINAHGGCIMKDGATYYWYGEHRSPQGQRGVMCYTSTDLKNWQNRGLVMENTDSTGIIERPKVIHNLKTGKYVMWFHHELKGRGYGAAQAGVAVADNALGPFKVISSGRVNPGRLPQGGDTLRVEAGSDTLRGWSPEWLAAVRRGLFTLRDLDGGQMARDQTVYVDADSTAWHIYSSEENLTLHIAELDSTYTRHTGRYVRLAPAGHNEAPVIFRHGGKYWLITSGCTGWAPNAARMFSAPAITGPWTQHANPCRGEGADKTFGSQGTYIFQNPQDDWVFMADQWEPENLQHSGHLFITVRFDEDGTPYLQKQANFRNFAP